LNYASICQKADNVNGF